MPSFHRRPPRNYLVSLVACWLPLSACESSSSTPITTVQDGLGAGNGEGGQPNEDAAAGAGSEQPMATAGSPSPSSSEDTEPRLLVDAGNPSRAEDAGAPDTTEPVLVTSSQDAFWQVGEPNVVETNGATATVSVLTEQELQPWDGFGGTFNEAGWDALSVLTQPERERAIRLLFDDRQGANFSYGRLPIGSSDYGLERYSLAEQAGDFDMESFSIERDQLYLIPYVRAALTVKPDMHLWASPWSPPPWMKDNNAFDRGNMSNDPQTLRAHALYLARFVEAYAELGITIEAVHPQNEPGYAQDYPSCSWTPAQMSDYIANHLGPLFAERNLTTEIWLGTMSNPNSTAIVDSVMGNPVAAGYVRGIGLQWNMVDSSGGYAADYQVPVMQTEHRAGNYPWVNGTDQTIAPNDYAYALESWGLLTEWIRAGVHSYLAWNMVLDTQGRSLDEVRPWAQNALLAVDRATQSLVVTPTYFVFRHLSQFVEPGAVRLATQGGDALAFRNPDGSLVTVLHNQAEQSLATTLDLAGTLLQIEVPAQGWATVNWQGE